MSCLQPKATRDGNKLRKRLQNEAQKAYDKHKLAEEQLEAEKLKLLSKAAKDESSDQDDKTIFDSRGLYFVDLETVDATNGEESDSIFSSNSVYFKNTLFNKFYKTFLSTEKKLRLSWAEYICFTFLLHVPLVYIYRHIYLVGTFGAVMVMLIYTVICVTISVPVYMVYVFLGNYTRRSYIRFWNCVPLLKGLAYSIAIQGLFLEIFNVILAAIALYYTILMFSKSIPWADCTFEYSSDNCMVANPNESYNKTCCHPFRSSNCTIENNVNLSKFSSYDYFNNYVMRIGNKTAPIQTGYLAHLLINAEIIWFVIFIFVAIGLRRCAKVFSVINMAMYITLVPVMLYTFAISSRYTMMDYISSDFSSLKDYRVWIHTSVHVLHRELPADVLTLSAASKPGISITVDTVIIYVMKLFYTITITLWMSLTINFASDKYKIMDTKCLLASGDVILFALFPEYLASLPAPQIWLIGYFLTLFFWGLSSAVYVYNSFLEALCEEFPIIHQWRIFLSAGLCLLSGVSNIFILNPKVFTYYESLSHSLVDQKAAMLLFSLAGLYLYSISRIKNDYHFYSGAILGNYWVAGIKVATLVITLSTIGLVYYRITGTQHNKTIFIIVMAPTLIGMIISSMRFSLRISKTLISPNSKWGPPNRRQRAARIRFDPTHDLRYRSITHSCNHNCLLHSSALKKEMRFWLNKSQQCMQQQEELTNNVATADITATVQ